MMTLKAFVQVALLFSLQTIQLWGGETEPPKKSKVSAAFTVRVDGSASFKSVQEAIDAAAKGEVIKVGPGVYEGHLVIKKSLTLAGAGWDKTTFTARAKNKHDIGPEEIREAQKRIREAATEAEKKAIIDEYRKKHMPSPVLSIQQAGKVRLSGIKLTLGGSHAEGRIDQNAIIAVSDSQVDIGNCVVAGSPGNGINIGGRSKAKIHHCLVAGAWGSGISVVGNREGQEGPPQVHIVDCDVRNGYHRCITIEGKGEDVVVENCRISGSAWHGIRYDHAAPTIRHNLIFDNDRFGIYASGSTAAIVEQNLFYGNHMSGISCWSGNSDIIRSNTFAGNKRSGLELLRGCTPEILRNIFYGNPQAIYREPVKDQGLSPAVIMNNYFWKNEWKVATTVAENPDGENGKEKYVKKEMAMDESNETVDPGFTRPDRKDFVLLGDSPARKGCIGAAEPIAFKSPWPVQAEEKSVIRHRRVSKERAEAQLASRRHDEFRKKAQQLAKPWIDAIMQAQDPEKRGKGLARMRKALAGDDQLQRIAGIVAFMETREANYDKKPFRAFLLPLIDAVEGRDQVLLFYAIRIAGQGPGDLDLLFRVLEKPSFEMKKSASHLLKEYAGRKLTGRAADIICKYLEAEDRKSLRDVITGLWGAEVSPALEARVLVIARTRSDCRGDAIYYGLSTFQNKSKAVIEELMKCIDAGDRNAGRAMWGLGHGIPAEYQSMVADFAVKVFDARDSKRIREECLDILRKYAGPKHREVLKKMAGNEMLHDDLRDRARRVVQRISKE